jgi:predicted nucleic acid-binding protein
MQKERLLHLDNSYLTDLFNPVTPATGLVTRWLLETETRIWTCSIAWHEFLRGPSGGPRNSAEVLAVKNMLNGGISPFTEAEANKAAELFHIVGRPKSQQDKRRLDCFIAASAILANAELATFNIRDFAEFEGHGLRLIKT